MQDHHLDRRDLNMAKRTVDNVEYDPELNQIVVQSTDYGATIMQCFDFEPKISTGSGENEYYIDIKVERPGYCHYWRGGDAGEASEKAHKAASRWARENTRAILSHIPTIHEQQKKNAEENED